MNRVLVLLICFIVPGVLFGEDFEANESFGVKTAKITIDSKKTYQTIEGFGASVAWYEISFAQHPNREDIYYHAFQNLGLSILRLKNGYQYQTEENFNPNLAEIVRNLYKYSDRNPKILMSLWSPPPDLKSNNALRGGTLKRDENGKFIYDAFARYWIDSLKAYKKMGIVPDYISIQNEPSHGEWESCFLYETESADTAGYDKALEAVSKALQSLQPRPQILAPEEQGIDYNIFQNFARFFNKDLIYGYAYHLYHGESDRVNDNHNPDLFIPNLERIAKDYSDKPIFQTEYDRGDWFNTAWIMHNCLVYGNVSAYLYWALVWQGDKGLIQLESLGNPSTWTTSEGYVLTPYYYAFRQYSKFISPGWKRISAGSTSENLKISAYINPAKDAMTIVMLNVSNENYDVSIGKADFESLRGGIFRTSETEHGKYIGLYRKDTILSVPSRSITTLALDVRIIN
ncbi:MAG: glycoside hydrolase family 30 beta sandwich domain-containing protein [Candidatus Ratteibacteria bacterium]|nr:glycoside hydrolase family 30 beta sandwich domain-containing protein [Candidatus Ratteibacteria bacterium]